MWGSNKSERTWGRSVLMLHPCSFLLPVSVLNQSVCQSDWQTINDIACVTAEMNGCTQGHSAVIASLPEVERVMYFLGWRKLLEDLVKPMQWNASTLSILRPQNFPSAFLRPTIYYACTSLHDGDELQSLLPSSDLQALNVLDLWGSGEDGLLSLGSSRGCFVLGLVKMFFPTVL